jgi:hypothetical protein
MIRPDKQLLHTRRVGKFIRRKATRLLGHRQKALAATAKQYKEKASANYIKRFHMFVFLY